MFSAIWYTQNYESSLEINKMTITSISLAFK